MTFANFSRDTTIASESDNQRYSNEYHLGLPRLRHRCGEAKKKPYLCYAIKKKKNMGYIKVNWPQSQVLMDLEEEEMDDLGIEFGEDCSYFVPEDAIEELEEEYGIIL